MAVHGSLRVRLGVTSSDDFGVTRGSLLGGHSRVTHVATHGPTSCSWIHFGLTGGYFEVIGVMLGVASGFELHFGTFGLWGLLGSHFGVTMGVALRSLWDHFGLTLGSLWGHFGSIGEQLE